jgi:hypothetical protein
MDFKAYAKRVDSLPAYYQMLTEHLCKLGDHQHIIREKSSKFLQEHVFPSIDKLCAQSEGSESNPSKDLLIGTTI